jgi:hypothetical protein
MVFSYWRFGGACPRHHVVKVHNLFQSAFPVSSLVFLYLFLRNVQSNCFVQVTFLPTEPSNYYATTCDCFKYRWQCKYLASARDMERVNTLLWCYLWSNWHLPWSRVVEVHLVAILWASRKVFESVMFNCFSFPVCCVKWFTCLFHLYLIILFSQLYEKWVLTDQMIRCLGRKEAQEILLHCWIPVTCSPLMVKNRIRGKRMVSALMWWRIFINIRFDCCFHLELAACARKGSIWADWSFC